MHYTKFGQSEYALVFRHALKTGNVEFKVTCWSRSLQIQVASTRNFQSPTVEKHVTGQSYDDDAADCRQWQLSEFAVPQRDGLGEWQPIQISVYNDLLCSLHPVELSNVQTDMFMSQRWLDQPSFSDHHRQQLLHNLGMNASQGHITIIQPLEQRDATCDWRTGLVADWQIFKSWQRTAMQANKGNNVFATWQSCGCHNINVNLEIQNNEGWWDAVSDNPYCNCSSTWQWWMVTDHSEQMLSTKCYIYSRNV